MLHVMMYHYIRDLPRTRFPRIKGMLSDDFRAGLSRLSQRFEMATLESALAFLRGAYRPKRDICLLTFDDGLKDHFTEVTPQLLQRRIQGVFFVISSCLEERRVVPVHMNHFLMADLGFEEYRSQILRRLRERDVFIPELNGKAALAASTYPWDMPEIAQFKYLFNFVLDPAPRDAAVQQLFQEYIGPEREFAGSLYLSWYEAREMQSYGMLIGGHSHLHRPLAQLNRTDLCRDLHACTRLLHGRLAPQQTWPFCYPYGKKSSFSQESIQELATLEFACAFSTEKGLAVAGDSLFAIRRLDGQHPDAL